MSKPSRKCIFCGKGGMSKAHIFPGWLGEELRPDERTTHHIEMVGHFETFKSQVRSPPATSRVRQGDSGTRRIRKVCTRCNSEWMSDMETPVRPHVLCLMNGDTSHQLNEDAQRILVAWLALIATLFDAMDPARSAIPQVDRVYLMKHHLPPPDWKIWLARYAGADWQGHRCRSMSMRISERSMPIGDELSCNTQVTTLVLRQLCAHIYSSSVMPFDGYGGIDLIQLWPISYPVIFWRDAPLIDDAHVVSLAESLARELPSF